MAETSTFGKLMSKGVMARLGRYGYAVSGTPTEPLVSTASLSRMVARLTALPGVSNDPRTRQEITAILEKELGPR